MRLFGLNKLLIMFWYLLAILDCATTHYCLQRIDLVEGNPIAAILMNVSEPYAYTVKMAISLLMVILLWHANKTAQVRVFIAVLLASVGYSYIVANHCLYLFS